MVKMETSEKFVCARGLNKGCWENKYLFDNEAIRNIDLLKNYVRRTETLLENYKKVAPGKKNRYFEKPSRWLASEDIQNFRRRVRFKNIVFILYLKKDISHCTNHRVSEKI